MNKKRTREEFEKKSAFQVMMSSNEQDKNPKKNKKLKYSNNDPKDR